MSGILTSKKKLFKPWLKIVPLYIDSHITENLVFCMNEQKTKGNKDFKFCLAYNCEELWITVRAEPGRIGRLILPWISGFLIIICLKIWNFQKNLLNKSSPNKNSFRPHWWIRTREGRVPLYNTVLNDYWLLSTFFFKSSFHIDICKMNDL